MTEPKHTPEADAHKDASPEVAQPLCAAGENEAEATQGAFGAPAAPGEEVAPAVENRAETPEECRGAQADTVATAAAGTGEAEGAANSEVIEEAVTAAGEDSGAEAAEAGPGEEPAAATGGEDALEEPALATAADSVAESARAQTEAPAVIATQTPVAGATEKSSSKRWWYLIGLVVVLIAAAALIIPKFFSASTPSPKSSQKPGASASVQAGKNKDAKDEAAQAKDGQQPQGGKGGGKSKAEAKQVPSPVKKDDGSPKPTADIPAKKPAGVAQDHYDALTKAKVYIDVLHMSQQGVYDQLISDGGEGFSKEAAQYAIDTLKVDYNQVALANAWKFRTLLNMSDDDIRRQLTSDWGGKFTAEQADYALKHLPAPKG